MNLKEKFAKLKFPLIEFKLPHLKEDSVRELILLAGFGMIFIGVCGYDWRLAFILGGWMLMKFSGLVKRVIA